MKASTKRKIRKIISPFRRIGLKNKKFSIISNNCWGGYIYDIYGLKYLTPTIGLYFFSKEYLKFIGNLKYYLSIDIKPLNNKDSKYYNDLIKKHHQDACLGIIDDVEVVFLHYNNSIDACKKWNNRRKRVNFNNLLIKYNDQNLFEEDDFYIFNQLNYDNKLFFTANEGIGNYDYVVFFDKFKNNGYVLDDIKTSRKYVKYKKILNELLEVVK